MVKYEVYFRDIKHNTVAQVVFYTDIPDAMLMEFSVSDLCTMSMSQLYLLRDYIHKNLVDTFDKTLTDLRETINTHIRSRECSTI
jgi:hypothetical protein